MSFEEIYKTHWQKVFRICMGYVNDVETAKDLAQETFIKTWQHLPKFKGESNIDTWILRIAINTCLRQIEVTNKKAEAPLPKEIAEPIEVNIDAEVQFLYQCISELPELERVIVSLELEGIKQKEIAKIVGVSEGNVRVKIHRIKEKLTLKFNNYER